jgi:hypothetical protein
MKRTSTIQQETEKFLEETAIIFEINRRMKNGERDLGKFYAEKIYGTNDDTRTTRDFFEKTKKTLGEQ